MASGFVLRALGGAVATHVPPSGWFLLVCSLGALMVAIAKRYTELAVLGGRSAARHRPVHALVPAAALRLQPAAGGRGDDRGLPALGLRASTDAWMRCWHLASARPAGAWRWPGSTG